MKDWLARFVIAVVKPFIKLFSTLRMPYSVKQITGEDYYDWRMKIKPGDIILTTTYGEFSNLYNPSEFNHGAMYVGGDHIKYVVEALGDGVVRTDLVTFLTTKDVAVIIRPKIHSSKRHMAAMEVGLRIGTPYDYEFETKDEEVYCFELLAEALREVEPALELKVKRYLGREAYTSDTFLDPTNFSIYIDSRGKK